MEITFVESMPSALEAGEYLVSLDQKLLNKNPTGPADTIDETASASRRLVVRSDRLKLAPATVHAVFPPANTPAAHPAVLPHLVLMSPALPWERELGHSATGPWLALLVFAAGDPPPPLQTIQAGGLQRTAFPSQPGSQTLDGEVLPAKAASYPGFAAEYGETLQARCQVVDVPVDVFARVAPSATDLGWLGHGRQVPSGELYSVLVANRLTAAGTTSTVHLVSLEGMADYLPSGSSYTPGQITLPDGSAADSLRLISLYSWSFTSAAIPVSFDQALTQLTVGPLQRTAQHAALRQELGLGYTALDHSTRQAATTVSWYRGPFLPAGPPAGIAPFTPVDRADALVRYDPTSGMFDVSYAAAWELGRLLAIQNATFSSGLLAWRNALSRTTVRAAVQDDGPPLARMRALLGDTERLAGLNDDPPPGALVTWLAQLRQLIGVPFSYLIADEALLPENAIRFFQLDQVWIEALVDGAISVGRVVSADVALDAVAAPKLRDLSRAQAGQEQPISGFLLRSAVLVAWPGMGIELSDANGAPLTLLPPRQLAPSILLVMAKGVVARAEFHEPPQALHFGVDAVATNTYTKGSRYVTVPSSAPQGTAPGMATSQPPVDVTVQDGRMAVDDLAGKLQRALATADGNNDATGGARPYGAAEFALQMVEGAESLAFVAAAGAL